MTLVVVKGKKLKRGKIVNTDYFVALTNGEHNGLEICRGDANESAADVRKRAIALLAHAANERATYVRAVAPGMDGAACDVWILQGDPVFGFSYGRVYSPGKLLGDGKGHPTYHTSSALNTRNEREALESMLTHMADVYPSEHWDQFLWGFGVDVAAIRTEIRQRDAKRAEMR